MNLMALLERIDFKVRASAKKIAWKLKYGNRIKIGVKVSFRKRVTVNLSDEGHIRIGAHVFFNNDCSINSHEMIIIGDDCIFGENVKVYDHNHIFNSGGLIRNAGWKTRTVSIGKNCWIGSNVVILKGAVIGDNCTIGAGCIISESIPDNTLVRRNTDLSFERIIVS